jgi:hypothetical protein
MASYRKNDDARPDETPWGNSLNLPHDGRKRTNTEGLTLGFSKDY